MKEQRELKKTKPSIQQLKNTTGFYLQKPNHSTKENRWWQKISARRTKVKRERRTTALDTRSLTPGRFHGNGKQENGPQAVAASREPAVPRSELTGAHRRFEWEHEPETGRADRTHLLGISQKLTRTKSKELPSMEKNSSRKTKSLPRGTLSGTGAASGRAANEIESRKRMGNTRSARRRQKRNLDSALTNLAGAKTCSRKKNQTGESLRKKNSSRNHEDQLEQDGIEARIEPDKEIHEASEQRSESRDLTSHCREQEAKTILLRTGIKPGD
jgi:hypothetical protein